MHTCAHKKTAYLPSLSSSLTPIFGKMSSRNRSHSLKISVAFSCRAWPRILSRKSAMIVRYGITNSSVWKQFSSFITLRLPRIVIQKKLNGKYPLFWCISKHNFLKQQLLPPSACRYSDDKLISCGLHWLSDNSYQVQFHWEAQKRNSYT